MQHIKCVLVGDKSAGTSNLLTSYVSRKYPIHAVFDNYSIEIDHYLLELFDTAGQDDYDQLRPLSYPNTDVFLVCFSVCDSQSAENVRTKWVPEIRHFCENTPFLLVGTQIDLVKEVTSWDENESVRSISFEEGKLMAGEVKAVKYFECSARTQVFYFN